MIALAIRILIGGLLFLYNPSFPAIGGDAEGYWSLAHNIIDQHEYYGPDEASRSLRRPPGYPSWLALWYGIFGENGRFLASFIQIILTAISAGILYQIITKHFSKRAAWIGSLIFALEPNSAYYSTLLLSDSLFVFFIVYGFHELIVKERVLYAGILLGVAALIRPVAYYVPLVIFIYAVISRIPFRKFVLYLLGFLLIITPWMVRNWIVVDSFDISSSGISTYYRYVLPSFRAFVSNGTYDDIREQTVRAFDDAVAKGARPNEFMSRELRKEIIAHPISYGIFHAIKTIPFFLGDGLREIFQKNNILEEKQPNISSLVMHGKLSILSKEFRAKPYLALTAVINIWWIGIIISALYGTLYAWRDTKNKKTIAILFALLILFFALLSGPASTTRHRMSALPFLAGLAAIGCDYWLLRKTKTRS